MSEQNPYAILGVPPNATDKEIRKAYISRCKVLHPDRFDPKTQPKEWAQANEMHAELNRAYSTLRNVSQQSGADAQASATQEQAASPSSTPGTPPAPHRSKRPHTGDARLILGMLIIGFWGLYLGVTSLWRESGIDKVPHHLSLTELRDGTVPNNRLLRVSDAECDLGHGVAYLEHYTPQAYYIPLITPPGRPESKTSASGRRIILRLKKEIYDAHSGTLQNHDAPVTVEGIRLLNTDIESRIEEFLKKELGITNLDNVVVIDGGRQPIGSLLPIKVLIISAAWLLMLFFNFAMQKPKLTWSAVAVLCGAFAIAPERLSLAPDYESPLVSQAAKTATDASRLHVAGESTSGGSNSTAPATPPVKARTEKKAIASKYEKLRKAAEQGDAGAQYELGGMYNRGDGMARDAAEAAKWFRKAAETGNADAQYELGTIYQWSSVALKDSVEAEKWWRKAAEQGNGKAQSAIGITYEEGDGVSKDAVEAVKWLHKAAELGVTEAQYHLAGCYADGRGVPKNEIEALAWFYVVGASGFLGASSSITDAEKRLGQQVSLLAQQRSKEILKSIQAAKANSKRNMQPEQSEGANRDATLTPIQSGTGVFVTKDGLILTAAHVVKGVSSIQVQTSHGVKPGRLVNIDTKNDVALIKCDGNFQAAPVKAPRDVKLGQAVFTIGFPNVELQGVSPKMTRGEISSLAGLQDDPRQWQISVPVQPGNSGGPLFDEAGNVIGIIVAKLNAIKAAKFTGDLSQNVNYAVKSAPALQLLAPYNEKLVHERQVNPSDKVETVVEQCRESVVLLFGYGP